MAFPQHDGGFFVESDDMEHQFRVDPRGAAKLMARRRQELIGNELSRLAADEYLDDIMQHIRQMEDETLPDANLIDMQREIQWFMRPYLIDFLVEAHSAFALLPETLFLTVNLLDRYCSRRVVYKQHYQLVGCAALLIASKYGDRKDRVPQIHELTNMCCGLYDASMFTQMETHVLNTLDWTIGHPTVDFFSQLMVVEQRDDRQVENMAAYICEIALYHRDFVSTKPSVMARASLALARAILGRPEARDGDWDHDDNVTLLTLSQHLRGPTATLSRKYSSPSLSRSAEALTEFLEQQAAMARLSCSPAPSAEDGAAQSNIYSTPQKSNGHGAAMGFDGYLTPPITPDGVSFANMPKDSYPLPPRCPVTPSPQQHNTSMYARHVQDQYTGFLNPHCHSGVQQQ